MNKALAFDQNPENYDKWRPVYCEALFSEIISYANITPCCRAVEIGCGTGQATEPFLRAGCQVTAAEPGKGLAEFALKKFESYKKFHIIREKFEDIGLEPRSVDLVYSATAFHWVDQEIGLSKVFDMLKPGGAIALFWNRPFVNRKDDPCHAAIQEVYDKYRPFPQNGGTGAPREGEGRGIGQREGLPDTLKAHGFADTKCSLYRAERVFDAEGYLGLLGTYSDHFLLAPEVKGPLMEGIGRAIESAGGKIRVYDTMELYLGRKL